MNKLSPEVERFIHQLVSPLTTVQSAVDLLAHHYGNSQDQRLNNLIAALQRATTRLRQFAQNLNGRVQQEGEEIVIRLPLTLYRQADVTVTMAANLPTAALGTGQAVLVGEAVLDELAGVLQTVGWQVERVRSFVTALIWPGYRRPRLLVFADAEADVDPGRVCSNCTHRSGNVRCCGSAGPVMVTRHATLQAFPWLDLQQPVLEQMYRLLHTHVRTEHGLPRILLVDDEPDIRFILGQQLISNGFVVVTAPDVRTALQLIREQYFDLIILDRLLPDGDGLQVLQTVRADSTGRMIPVILLSAVSALDERVRSLQQGADDYVVKPCSVTELAARIRAILQRSERDRSVNPISHIPGNAVIEQVIRERLMKQEPFAVSYIDLNNFKGYNDYYGFFKGDAVILHTARVLTKAVHWYGAPDDFLGHIGGDDFVLVTTLERAQQIGQAVIEQFDATIPYFYSAEDRAQGYIMGHDRQGQPCRFPLLSLSIAIVPVSPVRYQKPYEIAMRAVAIKRQLKLGNGSCVIVDDGERG
jgi:Response regulators consisting of a CheY-like receiver domain and a winged-helix DNA-binding domain